MKLSDRAYLLLQLVDDHTVWEGDERPGTVLRMYFTPQPKDMWSETLHAVVNPWGVGDSAIFKSLERKGLVRAVILAPYSYVITEEGILALAKRKETT